jgi:hypothetical protein
VSRGGDDAGCLLWVKSAVLTLRRSLPVCPDERTLSESLRMSTDDGDATDMG